MWTTWRNIMTRSQGWPATYRLLTASLSTAGGASSSLVSSAMFRDLVRECGLSKKRLHQALYPIDHGRSAVVGEFPIAVAVSGGADSMALMLLLREYLQVNSIKTPLLAITVDHQLRPESSQEAEEVAQVCARHGGIEHMAVKCEWHAEEQLQSDRGRSLSCSQSSRRAKPRGSKMEEQARQYRYQLLQHVCQEKRVRCLFVAHNLGDQIETTLFRLGRASGINGLAGIANRLPFLSLDKEERISQPTADTEKEDTVVILRPLLSVTKNQLMATCDRFNQTWVHDPSNDDPLYDRVRIRQELKRLERERGQDILNLFSRFQQTATKAKNEFAQAERVMILKHVVQWEPGCVVARMTVFSDREMFDELLYRVLSKIIMHIGNKDTPPRLASITRLVTDLQRLDIGKQVTLGGCRIKRVAKGHRLLFQPEHNGRQPSHRKL